MDTGVGSVPATGARTSIYIDEFAHRNPIPAAARIGNLVYSSAIVGRDPATGEIARTLDEQCGWIFTHMRTVIENAGGGPEDIIKVTIWLVDRSQREPVNRQWLAMFPDPATRPARHSLSAELDDGQLVACDFVAVLGGGDASERGGL